MNISGEKFDKEKPDYTLLPFDALEQVVKVLGFGAAKYERDHAQWDGLCLPKDDPFWDSHHPMNGWGCKCWIQFLSKRRYQFCTRDNTSF